MGCFGIGLLLLILLVWVCLFADSYLVLFLLLFGVNAVVVLFGVRLFGFCLAVWCWFDCWWLVCDGGVRVLRVSVF